MEMTLNLTYEDGLKVVKAMKEAAIESGWDAEELDECGVIDEYSLAVDAALAAMGISISIDANPSCKDEDEDFDEDDFDFDFDDEEDDEDEDMESIIYDVDGHRGISSVDARLLMRCVAKTLSEKFPGLPEDILTVFIQTETMRIANAYGIEVVDTSEDE